MANPDAVRTAPLGASQRHARLAWGVIWISFVIFCVLAVVVPYSVLRYREQALSPRGARVEIIGGTVLFQGESSSLREVVASTNLNLVEGDRIRTTSDSQALISLFDGSTIRLWPETTIRLRRLRNSTYNNDMVEVEILQQSGHARVEVALPTTHERRFEWRTPQSSVQLREGSYRVEVDELKTELAVRSGSASVSALDQVIEVLRSEQTTVRNGEAPLRPQVATRNLIRNGDFGGGFTGWQRGSRNEEDRLAGTISLPVEDGRSVVRFLRQGSQKHGETYLHQQLDRDVTDFDSLRLVLDLKVVAQSLSGGGWLGSEYPLLVRVRYRDAYNSEASFIRGFYSQNQEGRPTTYGQQTLPNQWLTYSFDLYDPNVVAPRPTQLLWLEIEASGWDYESFATNIRLLAE